MQRVRQREAGEVSRSADIRYLCALIAGARDWISREPYIAQLSVHAGIPEGLIRREVETLIRSGTNHDIVRRYLAGQDVPPVPHRAIHAAEEPEPEAVGWWNREQGETENPFDFVYRTKHRLRMARYLAEWGRIVDWLDMAGKHLEEWGGWPWNEIRAYRQIAAEHLADPVSREAHELRHGVTLYEEEDDTDYALLAELENDLLRIAIARGWDWWEEYEGAVADGIPPELAAAKLIGLADR